MWSGTSAILRRVQDDPASRTNESRVLSRAVDVTWRTAPGFLALCRRSGESLVVDGPGADMWDLLSSPRSEEVLITELAARFSTTADVVGADTRTLLRLLQEREYVRSVR